MGPRAPSVARVTALPLLDELLANAWPPQLLRLDGQWRLRWSSGVTRRGNSALAVGAEEGLDEHIDVAEAFYLGRRSTPMFQVSTASAPSSLAGRLAARGYAGSARTIVAHSATEEVLGATGSGPWAHESTSRVTDGWFETYWAVKSPPGRLGPEADVCRSALLHPSPPSLYVALSQAGTLCGVGQLVIEHGWAGVQCMATSEAGRRQGVATAVLHHLACEATSRGVERMYLAVMADNSGARRLYDAVGFVASHEYRFFAPS